MAIATRIASSILAKLFGTGGIWQAEDVSRMTTLQLQEHHERLNQLRFRNTLSVLVTQCLDVGVAAAVWLMMLEFTPAASYIGALETSAPYAGVGLGLLSAAVGIWMASRAPPEAASASKKWSRIVAVALPVLLALAPRGFLVYFAARFACNLAILAIAGLPARAP
ncbi:MAG: hypothetical protein R3B13_27035 [Polyangiaceae bacterium]